MQWLVRSSQGQMSVCSIPSRIKEKFEDTKGVIRISIWP